MLRASDAIAWISLVETGTPDDPDIAFSGVIGELPLAELSGYFAPCALTGFGKAHDKLKAKAASKDRDLYGVVAPDGSAVRALDELRKLVDPAAVAWRSPGLKAALAFLFGGAPPAADALAAAEKFADKLVLDGGGDLLQFDEKGKDKLRCLPADLSRFAAARRLSLYNTGIRQLGDGIATLPALESIQVMTSPLTWITPRIGELSKLTKLTFDYANLRALPASIGRLPLTELRLTGCMWLKRLPAELASVTTLRTLDLKGCAAHGEGLPAYRGRAIPPDPEAAAVVAAIRAANPSCTIVTR